MEQKQDRVMRKKEVLATVGLSDVSIWRQERAGTFPRRMKLGGNSVGWLKSEIDGWLQDRATERAGQCDGN
ncbi:MAG: helix-turn-helix transcriptional regulator [Desulfobulbia bacterium]